MRVYTKSVSLIEASVILFRMHYHGDQSVKGGFLLSEPEFQA